MTERLLLLSPFFHPEPIGMGRYNSYLAQLLAKQGVAVDVLCFHPLYPRWRPRRSKAVLPGVRIRRGGAWLRFPKAGLLRRAVLEISFCLYILRNAGRIRAYSQIVVVLPPMLFVPLVRMIAAPGARVTAVVHDLQGILAAVGSSRSRRLIMGLIRALEAKVLKGCHRVIAISNGMADYLSRFYHVPSSKIAVYPPFVTVDTRNAGCELDHLFAGDKKHVVYAGALGEKQNPKSLIAFFIDLIEKRDDVVCHVFSGGPIFEAMRRNGYSRYSRLVFHDFIPDQVLYELYLCSHIQVIPERIGFSAGAFPSKLPNLLASGVPILYIGQRDSDVWRVIQGTGAGLCADSWDLDKLSALTQRLFLEFTGRSHTERRLVFERKFAADFSAEPLIRELIG